MNEIGSALEISRKLMQEVEKVDEKIAGLVKTSQNAVNGVKKSFEDMAGGVKPFMDAMETAAAKFGGFGKVAEVLGKIQRGSIDAAGGLQGMGQAAQQAVHQVQSLSQAAVTMNNVVAGPGAKFAYGANLPVTAPVNLAMLEKMHSDAQKAYEGLLAAGGGKRGPEIDKAKSEMDRLKATIEQLKATVVTYEQAMRNAMNAKDIPNMTAALKELKNVQQMMNGDTTMYREHLMQVNNAIDTTKRNLKQLGMSEREVAELMAKEAKVSEDKANLEAKNTQMLLKKINDLKARRDALKQAVGASDGLGIDTQRAKTELQQVRQELDALMRMRGNKAVGDKNFADKVLGSAQLYGVDKSSKAALDAQLQAISDKERANKRANDKAKKESEDYANTAIKNLQAIGKEVVALKRKRDDLKNGLDKAKILNVPAAELANAKKALKDIGDEISRLEKAKSDVFRGDKMFATTKIKNEGNAKVRSDVAAAKKELDKLTQTHDRSSQAERLALNVEGVQKEITKLKLLRDELLKPVKQSIDLGISSKAVDDAKTRLKAVADEKNRLAAMLKSKNVTGDMNFLGKNVTNAANDEIKRYAQVAKKTLEGELRQMASANKTAVQGADNAESRRLSNLNAVEKKMQRIWELMGRLNALNTEVANKTGRGLNAGAEDMERKLGEALLHLRKFQANGVKSLVDKDFKAKYLNTNDLDFNMRKASEQVRQFQKELSNLAAQERKNAADNKRDAAQQEASDNRKKNNLIATNKQLQDIEQRKDRLKAISAKQLAMGIDNSKAVGALKELERRYNILWGISRFNKTKMGAQYDALLRQKGYRQQELNNDVQKKAKADADAVIREQERVIKNAEQNAARMGRLNSQSNTRASRVAYYGTYDNAMKYADDAKSVNQRTQAIQYLTAARDKLRATDANYYRDLNALNAKIQEMNRLNRQAVQGAEELRRSHSRLLDISGQLTRQLALVFSVSAIKGYAESIAKVRGEMELQQVALRAILQNRSQADQIFNKTKQLATQSPFRVQQLATYTKQLAAYRIESNKLYDTTKRLADVSAGLGVDMQRLILAYGQVKAAAYLRGTEVRQFTEAGVNLYGELQKYYQDIHEKTYSTAQIVDMISKRKVTFEDIEAVFKRLTDEGGIFYDMQRIQSETLYGKIEKLKDVFYLMQDEIGKSNESVIGWFVDGLTKLMKHWKEFSGLLWELTPALASLAIGFKLTGAGARALGGDFLVLTANINGFLEKTKFTAFLTKTTLPYTLAACARGFQMLGRAAMAAGVMLVKALPILLIFEVGKAIWDNYRANEAYRESVAKTNDEYMKSLTALKKNAISAKNYRELLTSLKQEMSNRGFHMDITPAINEEDAEKKYKIAIKEFKKYLFEIRKIENRFNKDKLDNTHWYGDDTLEKNAKDYSEYVSKIVNITEKLDNAFAQELDTNKKLTQEQSELLKGLLKTPFDERSSTEYFEKVKKAQGFMLNQSMFKLYSFDDMYDDWEKGADRLNKSFERVLGVPHKFKNEAEKNKITDLIDEFSTEHELSEVAKMFAYKKWEIVPKIDQDNIKKEVSWLDIYLKEYFNNTRFNVNIDIDKLPDNPLEDYMAGGDDMKKQYDKYKELQKRLSVRPGDDRVKNNGTIKALIDAYGATVLQDAADVAVKDVLTVIDTALPKMEKTLKEFYGIVPDEKKKNNKDARDILAEQIDLLEKMNAQYEKLHKTMGGTKAAREVRKNFAGAIAESEISKDIIDNYVPDKAGLAKALEKVYNTASAAANIKTKNNLKQKIGEMKVGIKVDDGEKAFEDMKRSVEGMFSKMDLRLKLRETGLLDTQIDEIFPELKEMPEDMGAWLREKWGWNDSKSREENEKNIGENEAKQYLEDHKKLEEQENKRRESTLEQLLKDYRNHLSGQLELDRWYAKEKANIDKYVTDPAMNQEMTENLDKGREKKQADLNLKTLKESVQWTGVFDNIETASESAMVQLKAQLEGMRDEIVRLDPTKVKEVDSALQQLNDALYNERPFAGLAASAGGYFDYLLKARELERTLATQGANIETLTAQEQAQEKALDMAQQEYDVAVKKYGIDSQEARNAAVKLSNARWMLGVTREELRAEKDGYNATSKAITDGKKKGEQTRKMIDKIRDTTKKAGDVASQFAGIWDKEAAASVGKVINVIDTVLTSTTQIIQGIENLVNGAATAMVGTSAAASTAIKTMESASLILAIISAALQVAMVIINLFNDDEDKQKHIEELQSRVDELSESYNKLRKSMDDAYDAQRLIHFKNESLKALKAEQEAYNEMAAVERSKKDADESRAKDYERKARELSETMKELQESLTEQMGGFGSEANYKSAAESFADAWVGAFNEGSNALDALKDNFEDYFDTMLKKQITARAAARFLQPLFNEMDRMLNEESAGGVLATRDEIANLREMKDGALSGFDEYVRTLMDALGVTGRIDADLSALQQGIQGVTEDTAQALESLLNSMRFFLAQQQSDVHSIYEMLRDVYGAAEQQGESPMLSELRLQTAHLRAIRSSVESVIVDSQRKGGKGLKVYID